ncbi:MAG: hypothetical protein AB1610_07150 [Nitrospirota bacterium]
MGTISLIDRQELKEKTDKFYTPSELIELFQCQDIDKDWSFIEYKPSDTCKLTHCYHRYPAKFIPQLVEEFEAYR